MKMLSRATKAALGLGLLLAPLAGWGQTSEWKWLTGGNLKAVKFIGQQGWIIGDDGNQGIILHSTDGGDTWAIQPHNTGRHYFNGLCATDSLNVWIVGGWTQMSELGYVLRTRDGGNTWNFSSTPTTRTLNSICAVDTLHLWVTSAADTFFRSTDGGVTWQGARDSTGEGYYGIDFVDLLHGVAVSGGPVLVLAKTTDGGITWHEKVDIGTWGISSIDMLDTLEGWGAGGPSYGIVRTRDGWNTWEQIPLPITPICNDITFSDSLRGYVVGGANGYPATIFKSYDGGTSWVADTNQARDDVFNGVSSISDTVLVVGFGGAVLRSRNSGNTWTIIRNADIGNASFLNGTFKDINQGWAVGTYGVITQTTNGGTVWQAQTSGSGYFLYGINFPTTQKGWVCSDGAEILTTTDAGNTWTPQTSNTTYPLFSIDFGDTLVGVAVGGYYGPEPPIGEGHGSRGAGERGGKDIADFGLRIGDLKAEKQILPLNQVQGQNDTLAKWGTGLDFWKWPWKPEEANPQTAYRTITRTTNGGALWIAQNTTGQVPLYGVSFVTPGEGWACGDPQGGMGVVIHTTDSGATWVGQTSNLNQTLNWIQFKDSQNGWCVGSGGGVLWTTDGGTTWNQGNSGTTAPLWSCAFYDYLNGFACGNNGLLIKTVDGGRNWTPDTSKCYANFPAVFALDSTHAWTVGSYGMVLGWKEAGVVGVGAEGQRGRGAGGKGIALEQSYPNPMKENCAIGYWLSADGNNPRSTELSIFDVTGRRIRFFAPLRMTESGRHTVVWDGKDETGKNVPAGVYFYQLRTKELTETKKLIKLQ